MRNAYVDRIMSRKSKDYNMSSDKLPDYTDRRDYMDRRDYEDYGQSYYIRREEDHARNRRDYYNREEDYGDIKPLSRHEKMAWKKELKNADSSRGGRFDMSQIIPLAEKMGVSFEGFDESDFCMVVNMLYSDFCEAIKGMVPPDKELIFLVKLAKAWLEDEDAPIGAIKLSLYKHCIVDYNV